MQLESIRAALAGISSTTVLAEQQSDENLVEQVSVTVHMFTAAA